MQHFFDKLHQWWKSFTMSEEERYLSKSMDHIDLENRLRILQNNTKDSFYGHHNY